jgi:hypothetical protein
MSWTHTTSRTIDLGYEQMLVLESRPQTRLKVIYGGIWLTEEGLPQDVFAASGDEVALHSHGLAVVEGLGRAQVEVMEPAGWSALAASAAALAGGAVAWLRAHLRRLPLRSQTAG